MASPPATRASPSRSIPAGASRRFLGWIEPRASPREQERSEMRQFKPCGKENARGVFSPHVIVDKWIRLSNILKAQPVQGNSG